MAAGELALVLHAHLPYVRSGEPGSLEEDWYYQALQECYLPLLQVLATLLLQARAVIAGSGGSAAMRLADGDRIFVAPLGRTVAVAGLARNPGIYELPPGQASISPRSSRRTRPMGAATAAGAWPSSTSSAARHCRNLTQRWRENCGIATT